MCAGFLPDGDREGAIRFTFFAKIVFPPIHHGEPAGPVLEELRPSLLAGPQPLRTDQGHGHHADTEGVVDELPYFRERRVGHQDWRHRGVIIKEVVTGGDIGLYGLDAMGANRPGNPAIPGAGFPDRDRRSGIAQPDGVDLHVEELPRHALHDFLWGRVKIMLCSHGCCPSCTGP